MWNQHPISGQSNYSSVQLFTAIAEDFFETTDESYGIDHEGPLGQLENDTIVVPSLNFSLSTMQEEQLNSINVLSESDIMGVDIYLSVLHIVLQ